MPRTLQLSVCPPSQLGPPVLRPQTRSCWLPGVSPVPSPAHGRQFLGGSASGGPGSRGRERAGWGLSWRRCLTFRGSASPSPSRGACAPAPLLAGAQNTSTPAPPPSYGECALTWPVRLCQPHGLEPARRLCPRGFPGSEWKWACRFLLQGVFPT